MLEGLAQMTPETLPRSIAVYWGNRGAGDLYWDVMSVPGPHRYTPVLSKADEAWRGVRGHVQDALMASHPDLSHTVVYACGSDAMIRSAKTLLTQAGLPDRCFLSDAFVCSAGVTSLQ
jgi:CDP-4-dehydro-6-deoxyglucose reductase, E3